MAFEESTDQIVANAATLGGDLPALTKKKLFPRCSPQSRSREAENST